MEKNWEEEFFETFGEKGNITNGERYQWKVGITPMHVFSFIQTKTRESERRGYDRAYALIPNPCYSQSEIGLAEKRGEERIKSRVGNLRQWINEKQSGAVTNEDILYFLGLASSEEVKESHEKEKRLREILFREYDGTNIQGTEPKCKNCWDKGYSTEYKGASYGIPDFLGDRKFKVANEGIVKHYCTCEKGRRMKADEEGVEYSPEKNDVRDVLRRMDKMVL